MDISARLDKRFTSQVAVKQTKQRASESQVNWAAFGGVIGVAWGGEGTANRHGGLIAQGRQQQAPGPFPAATSGPCTAAHRHPTTTLYFARKLVMHQKFLSHDWTPLMAFLASHIGFSVFVFY